MIWIEHEFSVCVINQEDYKKTNQEQTENYCKRWKIITERIELRVIEKLRPDKDKWLTQSIWKYYFL